MTTKKKISVLVLFLVMFSAQNSYAGLMIDPAVIAGKFEEIVQNVADKVNNIAQRTAQVKQMASQGRDKKDLFEMAKKTAKKHGLFKKEMSKSVGGTKEQNLESIKAEQEQYVQGRKLYYSAKTKILKDNIDSAQKEREEISKRKTVAMTEKDNRKAEFQAVRNDPSKENTAFAKYMEAVGKYDHEEAALKEVEELIKDLKEQLKNMEEEAKKVGTNDDPQFVIFNERIAELNKVKEDETFVNKLDMGDEWDKPGIVEKYNPTEEDYKKFIERYFYNPEELSKGVTGDKARIKFQTKADAVSRERRFLIVNTAAHLLQIAATIRREVPVRMDVLQKTYSNTPKVKNEMEAINAYAATRIENAKALLIYAKLQCARLQYTAARELLRLDGAKVPNGKYKEFNMGKYILTKEFVDKIATEAAKTNPAVKK